MSGKKVPVEHVELLLYLKRTLTTDALEDMKVAVRAEEFGGFQYAELENIKNVREMLRKLEDKGVIKVGEYRKLKDIMRITDNGAVFDEINRIEKLLDEKGYGIASTVSNMEMTSSMASEPHQPVGGYGIASTVSNMEMTSSMASEPHQPVGGYGIASTVSNMEMTSSMASEPHQPVGGYGIASTVSNMEMTSSMASEPHQPVGGYGIASTVSNMEMTSSMASEPHQPVGGETAGIIMEDGPLQAADKVEEILRNHYITTGSFVQIIPWVGDDMKPISDIYTKLKLQKTDSQGKTMKSYADIFLERTNEGHSIQRIVLKGIAGVGKSTLIDRMAYDWAKGEELQEYKLVFILKMYALEETSELIDAIFDHLIDKDLAINKDDLRSYITTNPAKVLILFDGFDEFKTTSISETSQSSGNVFQILNRKILRGSCVVVTTRPSHFHNLVSKPLIENPFVHVNVLGFSEEDIEQYIHRFFSKECDKAEGLIQKVKSSEVLLDLAKSPMLLLLMCILWREQSAIPDTMYRLYKDALRYIFERKQLLPDEASQVVISIGKIALDDLLSPHQFLSFKEGDFEDQALRSALKAGILTSQRVIRGLDTRHSVSFIHRTFQEYCAAIFFQYLLGTDEEQFNKNLDRAGDIMKDSPQGLEYLLRFCCGDNQSCTNKFLQKRVRILDELSFLCYFEGQFEDLPSVDFVTDRIQINKYSNDGLHAFFYYLKHVNTDDKNKGRENGQLRKVTHLHISNCNLESFGEVLGESMSAMTNLSRFNLDNCLVNAVSLEHIASSFVFTSKLTRLEISPKKCERYEVGGCLSSWGHNLRSLEQLGELTLRGCYLQDKDIKYIATLLGLMKNLFECQLEKYEGDQYKLVSYIEYSSSGWWLSQLILCDCSLTPSELSEILCGLQTRTDFVFVNLSLNQLLGDCAHIWAQHLKYLKHIRQLFLTNCALHANDIKPLAESLSDMSTLGLLDLSENSRLGGDAVSWAVHLDKLNQLKKLCLRKCSLTALDIEPIAKSIGNIPILDLNVNLELRHSVASWAPSLRHFKHLKTLSLFSCEFTPKDRTLISNAQQQMANRVHIEMDS